MRQPNIIVCMCDQLRAFELGCHGGPARTPNLDRFAANGVRFEVAISNNPLCTPARSCLLSGQYSRTACGMPGNVHENPPNPRRQRLRDTTLAEACRAAGYHTALIGKWHIDPQPQLVGFERAVYPMVEHRHYGQTYFDEAGRQTRVPGFNHDFELDQVRSWIAANRREPFFLFYNISTPHQPIGPRHLPERYVNMYDPQAVPLRANVSREFARIAANWWWKSEGASHKNDEDRRRAYEDFWFKVYTSADFFWDWMAKRPTAPEDELPPGFDLRRLTALYHGAISCMDDYVGALMDSLRESRIADDTIVVFMSDHGDNLGSHGQFNKGDLIEESLRIPLIFHWPAGLEPGVQARRPVQILDVMPSLLSLAGLPVPAACQGTDLAPLLRGGGSVPQAADRPVFIETPAQIGLRTPQYLYGMGFDYQNRRPDGGNVCMFDLDRDPFEFENLAGHPEHAAVEAELRRQLLAWDAATPWLSQSQDPERAS